MSLLHPSADAAIEWPQVARQRAFEQWFNRVTQSHGLRADSVRVASADASFRRYFRVDTVAGGSAIIMDAPPEHEHSEPFVRIAAQLRQAGVSVPTVLEWDEAHGFMLLSDMGSQTLLTALDPAQPAHALPYFQEATTVLLRMQQHASTHGVPAYDAALLQRELQLFPDWYVAQHKGVTLDDETSAQLQRVFALIVARNLAGPHVLVHRDFMPRNLMLPYGGFDPAAGRGLGVLDFQDAVVGPITYDVASLMRDAFLTWEEDMVLDVTIRYWERARKAGLLDFDGWSEDFGAFYRAVEWMGLQRHLKVAGIFARLTLRDGKPQYVADTPRFIHYIRHTAVRYRELGPLVRLVDRLEGLEAATGFAYGRM